MNVPSSVVERWAEERQKIASGVNGFKFDAGADCAVLVCESSIAATMVVMQYKMTSVRRIVIVCT